MTLGSISDSVCLQICPWLWLHIHRSGICPRPLWNEFKFHEFDNETLGTDNKRQVVTTVAETKQKVFNVSFKRKIATKLIKNPETQKKRAGKEKQNNWLWFSLNFSISLQNANRRRNEEFLYFFVRFFFFSFLFFVVVCFWVVVSGVDKISRLGGW